MLKINNVFKKSKKLYSKLNRKNPHKKEPPINQNTTVVLNEKLNFFLKENKPFNFVDYYINKNKEQKLKKINTEEMMKKIENSLEGKIIDKEIIILTQNLFYCYNNPNNNKVEFKEYFKILLDKILSKEQIFFKEKNNKSFLVKIFSFLLKIDLNYKIIDFQKMINKLTLDKSETNILINSLNNYLIKNIKFMDETDLALNIDLLQNFINLVQKENLLKLFNKSIDKFFLFLSSYLVNEKFDSYNYLEGSINKLKKFVKINYTLLNSFNVDLFKFYIDCDYNFNEELFILDNLDFNNVRLENLLIIFEGNNFFEEKKSENLSNIIKYYGKKYSVIKNRVIISKDFHNNLKSEFKTNYHKSKFYIISLFANKFNDLDFFIDHNNLLKEKNNTEKMNYFYINCLIKNVNKKNYDKILQTVEKNFAKLTKTDQKIIKALLLIKQNKNTKLYHEYFLFEDLKKNIERNLIIALKIYVSEEDLSQVLQKIKTYINSLSPDDLINLGFNVFTDKREFLKEFMNFNQVNNMEYLQYFGFTNNQYFEQADEMKKYSKYFRNKSIFLPNAQLDIKDADEFAETLYPFIGKEMISGEIKTFKELADACQKIQLDDLKKKEEKKELIRIYEQKKRREEELDGNLVGDDLEEKEFEKTLNDKEKEIHDEYNVADEIKSEVDKDSIQELIDEEIGTKEELTQEEQELFDLSENEIEDGILEDEYEEFPIQTYYYNMVEKKIDNSYYPDFIAKNHKSVSQLETTYKKGIFSQMSSESAGIDYFKYVEKDFKMNIHNEMAWVFVDHDLKKGIEFSLKVQHFLGKEFEDCYLQKKLKKERFVCTANDNFHYESGMKFSIDVANSHLFNDTMENYGHNFVLKSFLNKHRYYVDKKEDEEIIRNVLN